MGIYKDNEMFEDTKQLGRESMMDMGFDKKNSSSPGEKAGKNLEIQEIDL